MIQKLEVKGLNTRVDGTWKFNEDLNVITGRNGSGKTTLLKLIWYVISGNIKQIIFDIPFQTVAIETDSFSLSIQFESDRGKLRCEFVNEDNVDMDFKIPLRITDHKQIDEINIQIARGMNSLFFPSFRRIEGGFARSPRHTRTDDFAIRYTHTNDLTIQSQDRFEDRLAEMLQKAMSRLSTEVSASDDHRFIASISTHDIVELLTRKYTDVSEKTDELHAKLSKDITQKISKTNPLDDATPVLAGIQTRVDQVTQERESLRKPFVVLGEQIRGIFHYEGISVTKGITFGETKQAIESDKLSAGEKQMLSFLCYNTFSENAAIFIDEPELSLHVDWQRLLLPTLLEQETGNQFFIATHSPFIYAKYPDKEILLGEDRGGD